MNPVFEFSRLGYILKRQLSLNINSLWTAIAAIFGTHLVISAFFAFFNPGEADVLYGLRNMYLVAFFGAGYLFTSMVFSEMNSPKKSFAFLMLPASKLEKLIGAWLVSSVVFVLLYLLMMLLLATFSAFVAKMPEMVSHLFDRNVWICVKVYLVTQTLFFAGAAAFKGNNFLKTLLALFMFILVLSLYSGLLGYLLFGTMGLVANEETVSEEFKETFEYIFTVIVPFIFWYLLAPFMLVVSYFKLKERQV